MPLKCQHLAASLGGFFAADRQAVVYLPAVDVSHGTGALVLLQLWRALWDTLQSLGHDSSDHLHMWDVPTEQPPATRTCCPLAAQGSRCDR